MRLFSITVTALLTACATTAIAADNELQSPRARLQQAWLLEGLSAPEGVAVFSDTLLISNVAGEATEKDGAGWISRVSMDGTLLEEKWVDGLNAPKGMAIYEGSVYVSDIDEIRIFDAESGKPTGVIAIDGAGFLNDLTVWQGAVYVSDSARASIHRLEDGGAVPWLSGPVLAGVNGLLGLGDRLVVSTMDEGHLLSVSTDKSVTQLATGMKNADGIALLADGGFLVSSWPGHIWHVDPKGEVSSLLDTEADTVYQNDLTGIGGLIIVPNWKPGTVTAWRLLNQ